MPRSLIQYRLTGSLGRRGLNPSNCLQSTKPLLSSDSAAPLASLVRNQPSRQERLRRQRTGSIESQLLFASDRSMMNSSFDNLVCGICMLKLSYGREVILIHRQYISDPKQGLEIQLGKLRSTTALWVCRSVERTPAPVAGAEEVMSCDMPSQQGPAHSEHAFL